VIVTAIEGIVAVVVGKDGFAKHTTPSPDQPTKCVPTGAAAAVTVTRVPVSLPLAVPLLTVNPAIDLENAVAANAIATKSSLLDLFIVILF
jgi:hypothetical protein